MMELLELRQIRGLKDLVFQTVDATVVKTTEVHKAVARRPYAVLERIESVAAQAKAIEQVQVAITDSAYTAIRSVNQLAATAATQIVDCLEDKARARRE